ncbi:hypothetical protein [Flavobacterium sp. KACC 22763]|uniref:hypothetical protein n=1 Tax=Flavobacterium sp. KACC 22763 TaxID=3025668 RepID=UPI00236690D0|nr:hypothetical protein [Flavobacterium sp. KACC 22763]WDF65457.1 hypothetical protein PQ463_04665 [Flavobacterium sp. KACC 22763]
MAYNNLEDSENIQVLEVRNYLLKPNLADAFSDFFHTKFVEPMQKLGGYTLGEFKIENSNDRFVWLRGFKDMSTRVKFLNDFYCESAVWKENGKAANEMMINSDNVYLLKPLYKSSNLKTNKGITVIDFYICNSTLERVIKLFEQEYIPFLSSINSTDISFWISEMKENDFPRLPVFQDKNLLVTITHYKDKNEFEMKQKAIDNMPSSLKFSIQQLVTIHYKLLLLNQQTNNQRTKNDAN